ncbi:DUF3810 domain-containing protein [Allomuricauda sp. d1]|uniref:DUF3810 domain-containing protein n=1 Tax=Allomuricauda sp. d1 TaxID=3136725 RepID=UPI0031E1537E
MKAKLKNGIAISLLPQIILVKWLAGHPDWVEKYYSEGIYPPIAKSLRLLFGWIPFSVGDLLYLTLGILATRYIYKNFQSIRRKPLFLLRDVVMVFSIIYFVFHLFWGMNYHRLPLTDKLKISAEYEQEELIAFTEHLISEANRYHIQITQDSLAPVNLTQSTRKIFDGSRNGYTALEEKYPFFTYKRPSVKKSLFSLPLTYMGYGGYLNPFTNEAQVNSKIPSFRLMTISAHEIGHQLGYSAEDATNFIGFLASKSNPDINYRYGSCHHALAYCLSDVFSRDEAQFERLYEKLNPGIQENYQQLRDFWAKYENPTEPVFKSIFNTFLKANNQQQGIESYNYVVGLLIGYHQKYGF